MKNGNGMHTNGMPERQLDVNGLNIFVREQGDGFPLLLVNGLGGNVDMWGDAETRLARVAHTIAFDAPGTGRSSLPPAPLPVPVIAHLVWSLVDKLGHEQIDIAGYSLGGLVAQELAHQRPDRVRRLALVATACGWGGAPGTLSALALVATPLRYYSRQFYERTSDLFGKLDPAAHERLRDHVDARLRTPPSPLGYAYQLWAGMAWSSLTWLETLATPTMVLMGGADDLVPAANGVQLARLLPDARLHVLPDEGHLLLFDPQSSAHDLLASFFGATDLEKSTAWRSARQIDDDHAVEDALRDAQSAEPLRTASAFYRWLSSAA